MDTSLPIIKRVRAGQQNQAMSELWTRIGAFLSLRSANTQETYRGILKEWCAFLGGEILTKRGAELMQAATDLHAIAYLNWLRARPGEKPRLKASASTSKAMLVGALSKQKADGLQSTLGNNTMRKKLAALRRIYAMLISAGIGPAKNPFSSDLVPAPSSKSGQKRPTEMIDFQVVKNILSAPDVKTAKGLRDKAILAAMFGGALRRGEVIALRLGDVRKTKAGTTYLFLRATKGRKDSEQALPDWAAAVIWQHVLQRKTDKAQPGDFLFASYRGRNASKLTSAALSSVGLYKLFKFYCLKAGAGQFLSPHSARATAITKLLSDGVTYREVQDFSRHASVQMVEVYDKRRVAVDQAAGKKLGY